MHAAADDACQLVGLLQFELLIPASGTHAYGDTSGSYLPKTDKGAWAKLNVVKISITDIKNNFFIFVGFICRRPSAKTYLLVKILPVRIFRIIHISNNSRNKRIYGILYIFFVLLFINLSVLFK